MNYSWDFSPHLGCTDCTEPFARPFISSVFRLTVTDALGCTASAAVRIDVLENQRIYLPNVFSPNDDGDNDRLVIYFGGEAESIISAAVFDRWGKQLVEKKDIPIIQSYDLWDGNASGRPAAVGVYIVILKIRLLDGRVVIKAADVTLVR